MLTCPLISKERGNKHRQTRLQTHIQTHIQSKSEPHALQGLYLQGKCTAGPVVLAISGFLVKKKCTLSSSLSRMTSPPSVGCPAGTSCRSQLRRGSCWFPDLETSCIVFLFIYVCVHMCVCVCVWGWWPFPYLVKTRCSAGWLVMLNLVFKHSVRKHQYNNSRLKAQHVKA